MYVCVCHSANCMQGTDYNSRWNMSRNYNMHNCTRSTIRMAHIRRPPCRSERAQNP